MKRIVSMALVAALLLCLVPVHVFADESVDQVLGMADIPEGEAYQPMTTSEDMITMIMDIEGFTATAYKDVSQWSIGYGSCLSTDLNEDVSDVEWTQEEAEERLITDVNENYGVQVNEYCEKIGKQPSQQQFDALVSFTYNLGGNWMSSTNRLNSWLQEPTTLDEFINAMGIWCRVSGSVNFGTCCRRVREMLVFLYGEYYLSNGTVVGAVAGEDTELTKVANANLPYFKFVVFKANEGSFDSSVSKYSDFVRFYDVNSTGIEPPAVTREGYEFSGWVITRENNNRTSKGEAFTAETVLSLNYEITAQWTEIPVEEPENPDEAVPGESTPETEPEDTTPGTEPEDTTPETEPEDTTPETEPEDTTPETEPEDTTPETEDTTPETEPEDTTPETEPEDTTPETHPEVVLPFTDVSAGSWYYSYVQYVYTNGLMNGTSDTRFNPNGTMTRGMLVTVLYRMVGEPAVSEDQRKVFSDVALDQYYANAVAWAKANGIVNGVSDTKFAPNNLVTRQDAIVIFHRLVNEYFGIYTGEYTSLDQFADAGSVAGYAVEAVQWAVAVELLNGVASGSSVKLQPKGDLTRAQASKLLTQLIGYLDSHN